MTRKTGKTAVKAKQQMRAAKSAKYKRELAEAGVKLSLPKPSAEARKQREEELKRLYAELFPKKAEGEREEQAEQPPGQAQQPEQKEEEKPAEGEQQEQQEQPEQPQAEQKEQAEQQEQADEPQEKPEAQSD